MELARPPALWNRSSSSWCGSSPPRSGLSEPEWHQLVRVAYAKVAEFQTRGLVHFHVVVRLDGGGDA